MIAKTDSRPAAPKQLLVLLTILVSATLPGCAGEVSERPFALRKAVPASVTPTRSPAASPLIRAEIEAANAAAAARESEQTAAIAQYQALVRQAEDRGAAAREAALREAAAREAEAWRQGAREAEARKAAEREAARAKEEAARIGEEAVRQIAAARAKAESEIAATKQAALDQTAAVNTQKPQAGESAAPPVVKGAASDIARLRSLAADRAKVKPEETYKIGPEDLLEINMFDLPEMNRKVRVATSGYIQLPLIGAVQTVGRSEAELSTEIARRLATNYLQNPQVDVFVQQYKSQLVAVSGSVAKPGLFPLTRKRYTILDMISQAGGLTKEAGPIVQFVPAEGARQSAAFKLASAGGNPSGADAPAATEGISIDLSDLLRRANRSTLDFPVLAGDVIYVPEAGSFTVEGWVDKPGTYPITRNMTVLAALSAGGGELFPARLGRVAILRNNLGDRASRDVQLVDLKAIRSGNEPDVELRSGDIVRVPGWAVLMIPWGFYSLVQGIVHVGASLPVI